METFLTILGGIILALVLLVVMVAVEAALISIALVFWGFTISKVAAVSISLLLVVIWIIAKAAGGK